MTPENFCYWMHGLIEVGRPEELSKQQIEIIRDNLDLVFTKLPSKNRHSSGSGYFYSKILENNTVNKNGDLFNSLLPN